MPPAEPIPALLAGAAALEIIPPVAYSPLWLVLSAALVLTALGWVVTSLVRTRPRRGSAPVIPPLDLRADYLARIQAIRGRVRAGQLSPRSGHQALSSTVRDYVQRVSGLPVATMTLAQLRDLAGRSDRGPAPSLHDLADYVDTVYPPEFGPDPMAGSAPTADSSAVDVAADRAEQLVHAWV